MVHPPALEDITAMHDTGRMRPADNEAFEAHTFQQLRPMAVAIGAGSALVFFVAVGLGEFLMGTRHWALHAYGVIACVSAVQLYQARNLNSLWIGGVGGMVSVAMGYSTLVVSLSHPDLWFFSTGLSLTFAVIVVFHVVWHYLVSTALVWLVIVGVTRPRFDTVFDYALGALVVLGAVVVGSYTIFLLRRGRRSAYDLQRKLHELAHRDMLTGLPNRRAFMEALQVTRASAPPELFLLMLDIDDFKVINDTLGHDVGDQALVAVGKAIAQQAGDQHHGRIGGEEFAVASVTHLAGAQALAEALVAAIHALTVGGHRLSVSIGMTQLRSTEPTADLLRRADAALYDAKLAGKDRYRQL